MNIDVMFYLLCDIEYSQRVRKQFSVTDMISNSYHVKILVFVYNTQRDMNITSRHFISINVTYLRCVEYLLKCKKGLDVNVTVFIIPALKNHKKKKHFALLTKSWSNLVK